MVFPSIPAYLDPANWQQQPNHHQTGSSSGNTQLPPPQPPPPQPHVGGSSGAGCIRPGSMADRARMANLPMPETALKCPRCDSTNTKFCYFNNYSLTQPRHFCKTCRRYWTRGGALRNVPVGGGCRRNKRSKGSSSSKSPVSGDQQTSGGSPNSIPSNSSTQIPPMSFMAPLHHLSEYGAGEIGLNYSGISSQMASTGDINFLIGSNSSGGGGGGTSFLSPGGMGIEQWRLPQAQQFPFFAGMDPQQPGLFPIEGGLEPSSYMGGAGGQVRPKAASSSGVTQSASVKMEENQELNLSRQFLGIPGNYQYNWNSGITAWTDLSGFGSSSTSHHL